MTRGEGVLLTTVVLGLYAVGNIWVVQVSAYPLWAYVGRREIHAYHIAWWHSIWGIILAPASVLVAASVLMLRWRPEGVPTWELWLGVGLQIALVLGTALWWGPLMARLSTAENGLSEGLFRLMVGTHWIRVAIVTAYGGLSVWMLAQNAWPARGMVVVPAGDPETERVLRVVAGANESLPNPNLCGEIRGAIHHEVATSSNRPGYCTTAPNDDTSNVPA